MSYPIQPYQPNNGALVQQQQLNNGALVQQQQFNRAIFDGNNGTTDELVGSLFGLANRLMGEILRNGPGIGGISSFIGADPNNPHVKVFGISSMNVTQIARGPDGRPHVIQAHNERIMGPGGIWQTKKALRDPDRGIDKMQIGYFAGDRGEIIERRLDPSTGQYQKEIQQHAIPPNTPSFSHQWRMQAQQSMQRQPSLPPPQPYQYYPQQQIPSYARQQQIPSYPHQQQFSSYAQQPPQALPAPSTYQHL
jgi:hypothetical protein